MLKMNCTELRHRQKLFLFFKRAKKRLVLKNFALFQQLFTSKLRKLEKFMQQGENFIPQKQQVLPNGIMFVFFSSA